MRIRVFITRLVVASVLLQYPHAQGSSRWQPCLRWLHPGVVTLTPPGASATAYSVASFFVYFEKGQSFHHFELRYRTDDIYVCICMYVLYIIHQCYVFIVYINPITTFIVYIITFYSMFYAFDAIMFHCTFSAMTGMLINKYIYIKVIQIT